MKKHDRKIFDKQLKIEKKFAEAEDLFKLNLERMRDDFRSDMGMIIHNYELQEKRELDDLHSELMNGQITEREYKTQSHSIRKEIGRKLNFQLNKNEGKHLQRLYQAVKDAKEELGEN